MGESVNALRVRSVMLSLIVPNSRILVTIIHQYFQDNNFTLNWTYSVFFQPSQNKPVDKNNVPPPPQLLTANLINSWKQQGVLNTCSAGKSPISNPPSPPLPPVKRRKFVPNKVPSKENFECSDTNSNQVCILLVVFWKKLGKLLCWIFNIGNLFLCCWWLRRLLNWFMINSYC